MNPAHVIAAHLKEHGEKYDLTDPDSTLALALDLQDVLDDLQQSFGGSEPASDAR